MFKFGFFDTPSEIVDEKSTSPISETKWRKAEHILPKSCQLTEEQQNYSICSHVYGDITIKSFKESDVINYLKTKEENTNCILKAEFDQSDLLTAEYEGGLKVWECTIDLLKFMNDENIDFHNKRILDLGCGCGILGIYAVHKGAFVDFQDYNKEVIQNITIPNVILNCENNEPRFSKCKFYSGDWKSLLDYLEDKEENKYDYILTSETIYNPENYEKLHDIFSRKLKTDGIVYLAAKSYYFGVGGSTRQFEKHLENSGALKSTVCWKCLEGVQREIFKIKLI